VRATAVGIRLQRPALSCGDRHPDLGLDDRGIRGLWECLPDVATIYILALVVIPLLPETRGKQLPE
jgi:hypothetical protein